MSEEECHNTEMSKKNTIPVMSRMSWPRRIPNKMKNSKQRCLKKNVMFTSPYTYLSSFHSCKFFFYLFCEVPFSSTRPCFLQRSGPRVAPVLCPAGWQSCHPKYLMLAALHTKIQKIQKYKKGAQAWEFFAHIFYTKWTHLGMWLRDWTKNRCFYQLTPDFEGFLVFWHILSVQ